MNTRWIRLRNERLEHERQILVEAKVKADQKKWGILRIQRIHEPLDQECIAGRYRIRHSPRETGPYSLASSGASTRGGTRVSTLCPPCPPNISGFDGRRLSRISRQYNCSWSRPDMAKPLATSHCSGQSFSRALSSRNADRASLYYGFCRTVLIDFPECRGRAVTPLSFTIQISFLTSKDSGGTAKARRRCTPSALLQATIKRPQLEPSFSKGDEL